MGSETVKILNISGYTVTVYSPDVETDKVLYSGFSMEEIEYLHKNIGTPFMSVTWDGVDWDNDMTPWRADRVFRAGRDFGGGADKFIEKLINDIMPCAESALEYSPKKRFIAGYSLSGLFAIYAAYKTGIFNAAASMSGSMWYDGWIEYMESHHCSLEKAYFSVGSKEKNTRNQRMARVEECTVRACEIMKSKGKDAVFELNTGNHFVDVQQRILKGISWIMR